MSRAILILALALSTACSGTFGEGASKWTRRAVLVASDAVVLCDLGQTSYMNDHGKWDKGFHEANPLLGTHPSETTILAANLGTIAINTALYFILPKKWGTAVNAGVLGVEFANTFTQPSADGRIRFGSRVTDGCR